MTIWHKAIAISYYFLSIPATLFEFNQVLWFTFWCSLSFTYYIFFSPVSDLIYVDDMMLVFLCSSWKCQPWTRFQFTVLRLVDMIADYQEYFCHCLYFCNQNVVFVTMLLSLLYRTLICMCIYKLPCLYFLWNFLG